ncbi:nonselective cation channel [Trichoderma arundinaceum]|uniref:Nonselective cation channel n=1 Tax=Trichoderma arundinaceum TaxID=490622 RepID=A0A395NM64_TRIAR|nr:nonselective cation channel [Trichoderma arundinaceum]
MEEISNEDALSAAIFGGAESEVGDFFADESEPLQGPPDVFTSIHRLYDPDDMSIGLLAYPHAVVTYCAPFGPLYCLLANRVQFLKEQTAAKHQSVSRARATLCEIVATKILRKFHEDNSPDKTGSAGLLRLANVLVQGFDPFSGAPEDVVRAGRYTHWPVQERGGNEGKLTALELAILSESKTLMSSPACLRVVNAVYEGQVVYTPISFVDILPDHYKYHPVSLYDPRKAPLLNHYRLIVPKWRNLLESMQFMVLLALYILTMMNRGSPSSLKLYENLFAVYTLGWILDEFAAIIEHGWAVHAQKTWSFLDVTFTLIFCAYLLAKLYDVWIPVTQHTDGTGTLAMHILCIAAPVLLTRFAFSLMPDNIVFISLHAMMKDFLVLTFLTLWCVGGFFLALQWLLVTGQDSEPRWYTVAKWLLWIWFGLDGTGIQESVQFHVVLGPALIVAFAFLGNTLFLTILVAVLTNTFSRIVDAEAAEIQFRRAVLTFECVRSDAIFAYPPPSNILALIFMLPLKFLVSARKFHTIHVAIVRGLNLPMLLFISLYERNFFRAGESSRSNKSNHLFRWRFTGFNPHGDIETVFEADPPSGVMDEAGELDGLIPPYLSNPPSVPPSSSIPQTAHVHATSTMDLRILLSLALAALSAAQLTLTVYLPSKPNPFLLPPNTHATLSSLHKHLNAPLTAVNTFSFHNVSADSYLLDVHCATDVFQPLRVDVGEDGEVKAWETYRGNEWGNKGEEVPVKSEGGPWRGISAKAVGGKIFFMERPAFSVLSILKNPMILMGLVTMGIVFGMPYLMDNMDPELRAEFEERQKESPMNAIMANAQGGQNPLGNFDMAAYLAGSGKKEGVKR